MTNRDQFTYVKPSLLVWTSVWSKLTKLEQFWHIFKGKKLYLFVPIWTSLNQCWQILTRLDQFQPVVTCFDLNYRNATHIVQFWYIWTYLDPVIPVHSFWPILTHFKSVWPILTNFDTLCPILTHLDSFEKYFWIL